MFKMVVTCTFIELMTQPTTQDRCLLDQLALQLCPEWFGDGPGDPGWRCATACRACRRDASAMVEHLATEARLQGLPVAGDWLDGVATQESQPQT
jgi:hypothetical protein